MAGIDSILSDRRPLPETRAKTEHQIPKAEGGKSRALTSIIEGGGGEDFEKGLAGRLMTVNDDNMCPTSEKSLLLCNHTWGRRSFVHKDSLGAALPPACRLTCAKFWLMIDRHVHHD